MGQIDVIIKKTQTNQIRTQLKDNFLKGDKGEPGKDGADYDDSELRVLIQNNTKDINNLSVNKAEKTEVETLNTQVQTNTDNISNLDSIKANKEDLNNTNTQVLNNKTDIEILNENKADKGAIPDVSQFITDEEVDILLKNLQANLEEEIGNVSSFDPVIVEELPTENIQEKTMYLVLSNADEEIKKYDAYIYKDNEWKQIGSAELDPSKLTVNLVENSYDLTLTEAVAGGGTITLPSMYKVGSDRLDVYLNGEKLIKAEADDTEGHYYEVGIQGTLSNTIQITSDWTAEVGDVFEFTIRTNGEGEAEILDPLPIGSILEYDGDTVPEGYEEVAEGEIYSTEETRVGTWIDGKPLYRKVFIGTATGTQRIDHNIPNVDRMIITSNSYFITASEAYADITIPVYSVRGAEAEWISSAWCSRTQITLKIGSYWGNSDYTYYLVAEYTKTTD